MPASSSALTPRQVAVYEAVRELTADHGYPPSLREIGDAVGLASASSVLHHVRVLEQHGLLASRPGCPRARRIVEHAAGRMDGLDG